MYGFEIEIFKTKEKKKSLVIFHLVSGRLCKKWSWEVDDTLTSQFTGKEQFKCEHSASPERCVPTVLQ